MEKFTIYACVVVMTKTFGAIISDTRKNKTDVHQIDAVWVQ